MLEELGAEVVSEDLCFGPRYYWEPVPMENDPMSALVDRYIGGMPMPFKTNSEQRMELLITEAQKHGVQGAIILIPKFCTVYLWDYPYLRLKLEEKGISTLMIEGQENIPEARTRTRIEAFLETLSG
jgi:benzoyl-CoA reductase/2-hydroxyglutaryl-CoA dehydratase subunit BcrC/BadD/HgdB